MQKHILFSVLVLSSLLISGCKTALFTGQQDTKCARLIIRTDNVSITNETFKEPTDPVMKDTMTGNDLTGDGIISIRPSEAPKTDEDTDMAVTDYTDYTGYSDDYDEDKIVDLDDEPFFVPVQPAEPRQKHEKAEDKAFDMELGPAVVPAQPATPKKAGDRTVDRLDEPAAVSAQQPETPAAGEEAVKAPAVDETKDPGEYIKLAAAYSNDGKYKEALEAYKKASGMLASGDPDVHYKLGLTYLMLDDRDSALKEYRILKNSAPVRADTLYRKTVEKILAEKDNAFTVQVGAYKNINYAYNTVKRLQKNYIYAYIKKENTFNKVRIPGIKNRKEGEAVIKELSRTFGFRPVLLNAQQYP